MKKLVVTMSDDQVECYTKYTIPIFEMWAEKWNADFKVLGKAAGECGHGMWNYRTMVFYDWLLEYDRIAYFDGDIVINSNCPDIFKIVPETKVGLVLEDKGSRMEDRRARIVEVKIALGPEINWKRDYLNAGFYVVSRYHRKIFTHVDNKPLYKGMGYDCNQYMYNIRKYGFDYVDLGYQFNHMSMFSESWNGSPSRFNSYVIHYAGGGRFSDKGNRDWIDLMKDDIVKIYGGLL